MSSHTSGPFAREAVGCAKANSLVVMVGSATALAARCRNLRRGSLMAFPPKMLIPISGTLWDIPLGSFRFDRSKFHHLTPFLGFVGDELAEIGGQTRKHHAAQVGKPGLHL